MAEVRVSLVAIEDSAFDLARELSDSFAEVFADEFHPDTIRTYVLAGLEGLTLKKVAVVQWTVSLPD